MDILLAVGIGIGLSSVTGVRAYLPLALVGLFAALGLFALPAPFKALGDTWAIVALFALALLETVLDKVPALDRVLDYVQIPVRVAAGAVLFAVALEALLPGAAAALLLVGLVAGAVVAGVVAVLKVILRPSAKAPAAGVSVTFLSLFEDVVALVGSVVAVFVPLLPLLLVAFLLFFLFRVRKRRRRKYGGLRILGD